LPGGLCPGALDGRGASVREKKKKKKRDVFSGKPRPRDWKDPFCGAAAGKVGPDGFWPPGFWPPEKRLPFLIPGRGETPGTLGGPRGGQLCRGNGPEKKTWAFFRPVGLQGKKKKTHPGAKKARRGDRESNTKTPTRGGEPHEIVKRRRMWRPVGGVLMGSGNHRRHFQGVGGKPVFFPGPPHKKKPGVGERLVGCNRGYAANRQGGGATRIGGAV